MSTTTDLVRDLAELIEAIEDLMRTRTAREAPDIARELGVEAQLGAGVDALKGALSTLDGGMKTLASQLAQLDAILAGFESLADALGPVGDGGVFNAITDYLGVPGRPLDPLARGVELGRRYLEAGLGLADLLPEPGAIETAQEGLRRLSSALDALEPRVPRGLEEQGVARQSGRPAGSGSGESGRPGI